MEDGSLIARITKGYFVDIFSLQFTKGDLSFLFLGVEECVSEADNAFLTSVYMEEEVLGALKEMGTLKAQGSDNFSAFFFQSY